MGPGARLALLGGVSAAALLGAALAISLDFGNSLYFQKRTRTQNVANNLAVGAVVGVIGSGGAIATGWNPSLVTGISREIVATGIENGFPYVDYRLSGTNTSGATGYPSLGHTQDVAAPAAVTGQTWTGSVYVRLVGGSMANIPAFFGDLQELDGSNVFLVNSTVNVTPTASAQRIAVTRTTNQATCAKVRFKWTATVAAGATIDVTLRTYGFSLEQSAYATDPVIMTSSAARTVTDSFTTTDVTKLQGYAFTRTGVATQQRQDGTWVSFAANVPGITDKGFRSQPARTNSLPVSDTSTAVVGTPGTLPGPWGWANATPGLTTSVVAKGTEFGLPYIDVRLFGTPSATQNSDFALCASTGASLAATIGQVWTASMFARIAPGGSATGVSGIATQVYERDIAGAILQTSNSAFTPLSSAVVRPTITRTFTSASTAYATMKFTVAGIFSGVPVDLTLRIYAPQLEQGENATTPIITTGAAATRGEDLMVINGLSIATAAISALVRVADLPPGIQAVTARAFSLIGSGGNIEFAGQGSGSPPQVIVGGTSNASPGAVINAGWSVAASVNAGVVESAANGGAPVISSGTALATAITNLAVGNLSSTLSRPLNGSVLMAAVWSAVASASLKATKTHPLAVGA